VEKTGRLIVLGLSEPTLTMIFDNLESCGLFPRVRIINNLALENLKPFTNPLFTIAIVNRAEDADFDAGAFLGVNKPSSKNAVYELFKEHDLEFVTIIHRSSAISSTARLGKGVNVNSLVSIAGFATIGNFVSINRNASIGHHTEVGDFVTVNPGANVAGFVRIGRNTQIGVGATVVDGLEIGADTIIGPGSVVTKTIPSGVVACGNPCRVVRRNEA
jgi:sugar O-acyltransferase (sialic acid O-acetyltransferase NeuD family)